MKNKLSDLNNHLFAQLEKLGDDSLTGDKLKEEINRSNAMAELSDKIIQSASLTVSAMKLVANWHFKKEEIPLLLEDKKTSK